MNDAEWQQVGTVEVLHTRIYPLDPNVLDGPIATSVAVEPGTYPVYRKYEAYCWIMQGRLNEQSAKIGDGTYIMGGGDSPTGLQVQFPSRTYGAEEFADLLKDPMCMPGGSQALRFSIDVPLT
ncbi:hypothetical protein [Mycobacteroides abscessus]|uniref:hypothetical protein n=1 Tax=Mycobacteroides abscessus TaxID=36809 RepID=UPI0012FFFA9F|nr:hypothetical protein [Mycobacteroides abscessus]